MIINGDHVTFGVGMDGEGTFGVTMSIFNDGMRIVFLLPARTARAYARVMESCRRAALLEWRRVCELVRWCDAYRNSDAAWHTVAPSLWRTLARAIAFRAAARTP